jgi:hypothetical protein
MKPFKLITGINKERTFTMSDMEQLGFNSVNEIKWFCLQYFEGESDYLLHFTEEHVQPNIIIINDGLYEVIKDTLNMIRIN